MAQENIQDQIEEFMKVVLLREKIMCDRTWSFELERFFRFVKEKHPAQYPNFNETVINEYIEQLQQLNKTSYAIVNSIKAILTYSEYVRNEMNRSLITKIKEEKNEHPFVEEEDDIFLMEEFLFQQISRHAELVDLNKKPSIEELTGSSYGLLRDGLRNYLMFRLVIELGIDGHEVVDLNIQSLTDEGLLQLKDRAVPLTAGTEKILRDYIQFRKNYDETVYKERFMKEVFSGSIPFNSLEKMKDFFEKSKDEKTEEIESILQDQFSIAEKIQELEEEGNEDEKIEELENEIDEKMAIMAEMKKIVVFERKIDEYINNEALFLLENDERLAESDCIVLMEREAFPISMIQNTILNRWEKQNIDANIVGRLIASKNVSNKHIEKMTEQFKAVIEAGFQLKDRSIL